MTKAEILNKIEHSGVSISEIARQLKVTRTTIYTWIDSEEKFDYEKILSVLPRRSSQSNFYRTDARKEIQTIHDG